MDIKSLSRKAAGLFVQIEPEQGSQIDWNSPDAKNAIDELESADALQRKLDQLKRQGRVKSVDDIVTQTPGPNLDEIHVGETGSAVDVNGTVNFQLVYDAAGIPEVQLSAEMAIEMLNSIGTGDSLNAQRVTIKKTLQAMGKALNATPEQIVADASRKLKAIDLFAESRAQQLAELESANNAEIQKLRDQIASREQLIAQAHKQQDVVFDQCHNMSQSLDQVLEFFSLDVGTSSLSTPTNK